MNKTLRQYENMVATILELKEIPEGILTEPMKEGKWSIIEVVGHLYYWDKFNLEKMVPYMVEEADLVPFPDHDQHNEEAMSYIADLSVETVIERFVQTRKTLIEKLAEINKDVRFTIGGKKRKFSGESFIKIFVKHDEHHINQIHDKLRDR
ncbi:DinB family protein [Bacillus alkalicellulosilyticus]|uniref:DinB family protein n=1 Tax=Alkalihalobacterium alkalicellulosilyticum TaxID=1912214 RepID=UPI000997EE7D|nr:DinB family protein [Bacillus alkalicellulosilyticus]